MARRKEQKASEDPLVKGLIDMMMGVLEPLGEEELKYAIKNDIYLVDLVKDHMPWVFNPLRILANRYSDKLQKITTDSVREWFKEHRRDLAKVLHTKEGEKWLEKNIYAFIEEVFRKV